MLGLVILEPRPVMIEGSSLRRQCHELPIDDVLVLRQVMEHFIEQVRHLLADMIKAILGLAAEFLLPTLIGKAICHVGSRSSCNGTCEERYHMSRIEHWSDLQEMQALNGEG